MRLLVECRDEIILDIAIERAKCFFKRYRRPVSPMITKTNYKTKKYNEKLYRNMYSKLYGAEQIMFFYTDEYLKFQKEDYIVLYIDTNTFEDKVILEELNSLGIKVFKATPDNFDVAFNMIEKIYFRKEV